MGGWLVSFGPLRSRCKTLPRKSIHTEISPLRSASVEMTKGRAVHPGGVVAQQKTVFPSPWVGSHTAFPYGRVARFIWPASLSLQNISKKKHPHRDLSTTLRFGRDDKGQGGASGESSCSTENRFPVTLGGQRHCVSVWEGGSFHLARFALAAKHFQEEASTQRSFHYAALRSR